MNNSESMSYDQSVNQERLIDCVGCNHTTSHRVLKSANISGQDDENGVSWWVDYEIIQCNGCKNISFLHRTTSTEDIDYNTGQLLPYIRVYPQRVSGRKPLEDNFALPDKVRSIYQETHQALCSQQPILTQIGVRALLEAICDDRYLAQELADTYRMIQIFEPSDDDERKKYGEVTERLRRTSLDKKINHLRDTGILTAEWADIMHEIRLAGNDAAHRGETQTFQVSAAQMEAIEHLLNGIYILPKRIKRSRSADEGVP
jgi:hypothetical protein